MNKKEHQKRHQTLHNALDILLADYMAVTGNMLSETSVYDIMEWSYQQTKNPTDAGENKK